MLHQVKMKDYISRISRHESAKSRSVSSKNPESQKPIGDPAALLRNSRFRLAKYVKQRDT